jgi:glycyl-tRNA synthetase (class II)
MLDPRLMSGVSYRSGSIPPIKCPLVKKDGLPEKAREIVNDLKFHFNCQYDEKDSIGKRYRRQDAIGTPYCITIDHQTLEDNCVTLRNRVQSHTQAQT